MGGWPPPWPRPMIYRLPGRAGRGCARGRRGTVAENGEQLGVPAEDGAQLGEAYGLGPCTRILKARRSSWPDTAVVLLVWLGVSTLVLAPIVASGISLGPYTATAKVTADVVAGCLLLLVALLAWRAWPNRRDQMFWYPCGAAQLIDGEPEPRIARWEDVDTVTVVFRSDGEGATYLARCSLRDRRGNVLAADTAYGRDVPYDFAAEAARSLAPRLVPPLIGAYDAGEPLIFGDTAIGQNGITLTDGDTGEITAVGWPEIRRIDIYEEGKGRERGGEQPASLIGIDVGRRRALSIGLSGRPNGIFIPHLIKHAAGQANRPVRLINSCGTRGDELGQAGS